jgi:hypothetical protein
MAVSYSHKFGQIIGEVLEKSVEPFLREFAESNNLYLDVKEIRPARPGTKLTWTDINGNKHDLDFVLEKNGTPSVIGTPAAFIECAWRRYTKHSRNKAQEIQGAIIPLFEKYKKDHPFIGVILAGEFTANSLVQLKSLGFSILFFPYEVIINAFKTIGINAYFDEHTEETQFAAQVTKWERMNGQKKELLYKEITDLQLAEINAFISSLTTKLLRTIVKIKIWTMYGKKFNFTTITSAKDFIISFNPKNVTPEFEKYEAEIVYSNDDIIKMNYHNKEDLLEFLTHFI